MIACASRSTAWILLPPAPTTYDPPLSYLDPTNVAKIKVFAGISPVSVGGDSIGGAIVVETAAPQFAARVRAPWPGVKSAPSSTATTRPRVATCPPRWQPRTSASATPAPWPGRQLHGWRQLQIQNIDRPHRTHPGSGRSRLHRLREPHPHSGLRRARRKPPGRGQVRLSGRAIPALPQPAHGHARQRAKAHQSALPGPPTTGAC